MLQKLQKTSEAGKETSEVPVSEQLSCGISDAADADEPGDGGKVLEEHESDSNMVISASADDNSDSNDDDGHGDDDNDDAGTDFVGERRLSGVDGDLTASYRDDSAATPDCDQSQHSSVCHETESSDQKAAIEMMDHCSNATDSGHGSPYTTSADDNAIEKAAGILQWDPFLSRSFVH